MAKKELSNLLQTSPQPRLKNRTIVYLTVGLVVQVLFWYFAMPGPQLAAEHEPDFDQAAYSCLISAGLLLLVPMTCIFLMRDDFKRFGFGLGDISYGLKAVLFVTPVFVLFTVLGSGDEQLIQFYPLPGDVIGKNVNAFGLWILCYACFYIAFEFFYRGFLLQGADDMGLVQNFLIATACCVLIHVGKPFAETLASIPASILFAWITIRSRSFLYAFLIHFIVGIANDLAALWQQGALQIEL